ncbi:hypothetical protein [Mucilaginibacter glaciei]|uniref:Uncharacterized protein n=1 Tax=Mucilaginibacter glaciei TaxID=2772109 RepID=A0A926NTI2_9SPHI|nr:hypothetical protein [Mucilaginibacter glaciei]MBD1394430.1 hypothetical protein [Mucilaginibacter glaciei]
MKTLTAPGDPHSITVIMVPKTLEFHDHEIVRIDSTDSDKTVEKKIFRIVDGGEDHWELQFE